MNVGNVPGPGIDLAELGGHAIGMGREIELVLSLHVSAQGAQQLRVAGKDLQRLDADVDLRLPVGRIVVERREQAIVGFALRGRGRRGRANRLAKDFGRGGVVAQSGEGFSLDNQQAGLRAAFGHVELDQGQIAPCAGQFDLRVVLALAAHGSAKANRRATGRRPRVAAPAVRTPGRRSASGRSAESSGREPLARPRYCPAPAEP